ncbi:MAG: PEP-CTERM sorting domain-containing protein [Verrucomicrobia bacterium]|nr:PEP-CTERM sorting domain-containing protein [Verrucomicrobiota bacterium]
MKRVTTLISLCALVLAFAPAALADWDHPVKWDQLDPISGSFAWAQLASQVTADDFLCGETGWITDIEIIADPFRQLAPYPDRTLRITFWSDVPATDVDESHPGDLLWDITVGSADPADPLSLGWKEVADYVASGTELKFKIDLPEDNWFLQTEGNIYWIGIQGPPGFMWAVLSQNAGNSLDDAVTWATGAPGWVHYGWCATAGLQTYEGLLPAGWTSADLSFRLTGTAVPEPASLSLVTMGAALAGLYWRKKRA